MTPGRIYLDYQSTTPLLAEARVAMEPFLGGQFGNPGSRHMEGLRAREAVARARSQVAGLLKAASADGVIFLSGATEAANLAVKGVAWANRDYGDHLVLSAAEHPAVAGAVAFLESQGFTATRVPVDGLGRVDPEAIRQALTSRTVLVCVHQANHDVGTLQPLAEIHRVVVEAGIALFIDASAAGGLVGLDVSELPGALVSMAPHRFHGPQGVGILYRPRRVRVVSLLHGGVQEGGVRAGTENVAAIVGAGVAAEHATRELDRRRDHIARMQQRLWDGLRARIESLEINGPEPGPGRSPGNLNVSPAGIEGEGLALALDLRGVAIHSGPACVSGSLKLPPVFGAMGLSAERARASVLFSPGRETTDEEISRAVELTVGTVARLRSLA